MLTEREQAKRNGLASRKPYLAKKLSGIFDMEERGEVSPQIRLEKSYLCNFTCSHCSAEHYMDRHKEKVFKIVDTRSTMTLDDVRSISRQADELGIGRFVITGGEPLVMRDFDQVVEAIDPEKHYIFTDTNGWFMDEKRARHIKSIGVEKVQMSLDSFIEEEHDKFRNKPGSYKRVLRAVDACIEAGLNLILSTVLVKGRARTEEFRQLCEFVGRKGIGLYVSYAKPTGSAAAHPEWTITKEDADQVRLMEREFNVFTHMTPSYGSHKGCITVKGTLTVSSAMEVMPCPSIDMSLGNLRVTTLKEIIRRGMDNPWLGPHRPDCLIGENPAFIKLHLEKTSGAKLLPIPYGEGFTDHDQATTPDYYQVSEEGIPFEIGKGETLAQLLDKAGVRVYSAPPDIKAEEASTGTYYPSVKGLSIQEAKSKDFAPYRLSSALETAAALVAKPDLLKNSDFYAPLICCAKEADETHVFYFEQYGDTLTFNKRPHLGKKSDYWRAGLVK